MSDPVDRDPMIQPILLEDGEADLGNNVVGIWCTSRSGAIVGLMERHYCVIPAGEGIDRPDAPDHIGGGFVSLNATDTTHWTVEQGEAGSWDGLTLVPSILCRRCGHHGYIRNGRWVPA